MHSEYLAYMLRLWQVEEDGQIHWRTSLEVPGSDERHNFSSLDKLITFIQSQTGETHSHIAHSFTDKNNGETNIEIKLTIKPSGTS